MYEDTAAASLTGCRRDFFEEQEAVHCGYQICRSPSQGTSIHRKPTQLSIDNVHKPRNKPEMTYMELVLDLAYKATEQHKPLSMSELA
jgi:hypothetical protein